MKEFPRNRLGHVWISPVWWDNLNSKKLISQMALLHLNPIRIRKTFNIGLDFNNFNNSNSFLLNKYILEYEGQNLKIWCVIWFSARNLRTENKGITLTKLLRNNDNGSHLYFSWVMLWVTSDVNLRDQKGLK